MSEFKLSFERRAKYLFVKGTGVRKNLTAILDSTHEFTKIVAETGSRFILVDYSGVVTIMTNSDVFNVTRSYETAAPVLHQLTIALLINPNEAEIEKFWEEICLKRGFDFKIFSEESEADKWLIQKVALSQSK